VRCLRVLVSAGEEDVQGGKRVGQVLGTGVDYKTEGRPRIMEKVLQSKQHSKR